MTWLEPTEKDQIMSFVLIYAAVLFAFSAILLTRDALKAIWTTAVVLGAGYLAWGFYQTSGVPDTEVTSAAMDYIRSGLGLLLFGTIMFGVWFFLDLRRRMPR